MPLPRSARAVLICCLIPIATLAVCVTPVGARPHKSMGGATTVGGVWRAQTSNTGQALFAVSCFDALRCKAVGAAGTIRYTKNGGASWRPQANPLAGTSAILYRIACLAPRTCYVIARPDTVLVTHDGGVSWSMHQLPVGGASSLTDPNCISNQSADIRNRLTLCRQGLLDIACISPTTCYVVATPSAVFLTTDGGTTWIKQSIPATSPCQALCGPAGFPYPLEWISCRSRLPCTAGGIIFVGSHEGFATRTIEVARLGGPWTPVNHSYLRNSVDTAVCFTRLRCYGLWSTSPFEPGTSVLLSTDGGGIWNEQSSGSKKVRNAIACPTASTCYTVGNQGTITASIDGSPFVAQRSPISHDLYGITCVRVTLCVAVGNKGSVIVLKSN